jgi:hypothetical protein
LTTNSLLLERYYTQSTNAIPLFLVQDSQNRIRLRVLCINENNQNDLQAFETLPGEYDFSSLSQPQRIEKLYQLAQKGGRDDSLIAVYRPSPDAAPQVIADYDYDYGRNWYHLIATKRRQKYFHVYKVLLRPVFRPDSRRIMQDLKRLTDKSPQLSQQLLREADTLVAAGCLFNIDTQVAGWSLPAASAVNVPRLPPTKQADLQVESATPVLLDMGYLEKYRSEDRYTYPLPVVIESKKKRYETKTRDFSVHGLSLYVEGSDVTFVEGESIRTSFPNLKISSGVFGMRRRKLDDIPYEVMGWEKGGRKILRLRLMDSSKKEDLVNAMTKIIELNPERLTLDLSDSVKAASSSLYSALAAESTATLPLLISRDKTSHRFKVQIGMPDHPGTIADFFEVADGEFDFRALYDAQRIAHLTQHLHTSNDCCEQTLYLYKQPIQERARFEIHAAIESEFADSAEKYAFIRRAMEHDYRFVKLRVSPPRIPPPAALDMILEPLRDYSPVRATELATEYEQLIAVGDLLDITQEALEQRSYS